MDEDEREKRADRLMDRLTSSWNIELELRKKEDELLDKLKKQKPDDSETIALELKILQRRAAWDDDNDEQFEKIQEFRMGGDE
ncbi:MAG TPA: hypothetical protein VN838_26260 [Bradyrhizobium sp.]|nr:hypothetical protein [Bradyrhizobium sp.]